VKIIFKFLTIGGLTIFSGCSPQATAWGEAFCEIAAPVVKSVGSIKGLTKPLTNSWLEEQKSHYDTNQRNLILKLIEEMKVMVPVESQSSGYTYSDEENHIDVANYTSKSVLKLVSSSDYEAKYNFLGKRWESRSVFIRNFDKMSEISCSDIDANEFALTYLYSELGATFFQPEKSISEIVIDDKLKVIVVFYQFDGSSVAEVMLKRSDRVKYFYVYDTNETIVRASVFSFMKEFVINK